MSYIGNEPLSVAFLTDTFSGNGSTVAFTMSVAPANTSSILVAVTGVVQDPSTYSVSGTTLTFSAAPPTGTSNISVRYLGIPASGVTTTAYRTVTDTTATSGQTTFTIPSYTVGYVDVFRNGVRLAAADFTATTGTTIVLVNPASAGDTITTESFYVSSVLNAIPATAGSVGTANLGAITNIASGNSAMTIQTGASNTTALTIDTSQNLKVTTDVYVNGTAKLSRNPLVMANNNATQTFLAATTTKVLFQNVATDTNGCFSSSTFTPNVPGYYLINAQISAQPNTSNEITLNLYKNGSGLTRIGRSYGSLASAIYFGGSYLIYLNGSTDSIEIYVYTQAQFASETPYSLFSATFVRNA